MTSLRTKAHRIHKARRAKSTEVAESVRRGLAQAVEIAGGAGSPNPINLLRLEALASTLQSAANSAAFLVRSQKGERFDWAKAFAPTPDLPAATEMPKLGR